ncbi:MAG TPA: hypothetical protein VK045_04845 [Ornithinicoccus sp.]|nr:hypothetical protein [Ornithinicoccus sp.]
MPYLIGVMLFPPVMAVALWRARVVPLWAMLVVIGGSASFAVFAGPWWSPWCGAWRCSLASPRRPARPPWRVTSGADGRAGGRHGLTAVRVTTRR